VETVLQQCDEPADEYYLPEGTFRMLEMGIPGDGHEME
jgi:hypothetical protein